MKIAFFIYLLFAIPTGLILAWVDIQPNWDDTGISVVLLFFATCLWSYIGRERPWLWALSVGLWIPIFNIISNQNTGSLLALAPAFIGAYIGFFARRSISMQKR